MAPSNNKYLEKIKGDVSLHRERGGQKGGGFEGIPWLEDEEWDGRVLCCSESVCKKLNKASFLLLVLGLTVTCNEPEKESADFIAYTGVDFIPRSRRLPREWLLKGTTRIRLKRDREARLRCPWRSI